MSERCVWCGETVGADPAEVYLDDATDEDVTWYFRFCDRDCLWAWREGDADERHREPEKLPSRSDEDGSDGV